MKSSVVSGENRGSVNEILLKALQSGDKYGYEINKEIETKSGGKFFLKEASLYSGLKRLQSAGFITSYWQDGELGIRRHYYSITQKGLDKLNSSNFTWDSSKDFLGDMFKKEQNEFESKNQTIQNNAFNQNNLPNENLININNTSNNAEKSSPQEIKKNPFQIEVSPFQQSFFDLNTPQPNENNNENLTVEKPSNLQENQMTLNEEKPLIESEIKEENQHGEPALTENLVEKNNSVLGFENKSDANLNLFENKTELDANQSEKKENEIKNQDLLENKDLIENSDKSVANNEQELDSKEPSISYDELIKSYENNNYSTSLQKENVIDIASLLKQNCEINDSSIVFEKPNNQHIDSTNQNASQEFSPKPETENLSEINQNNIQNSAPNFINQPSQNLQNSFEQTENLNNQSADFNQQKPQEDFKQSEEKNTVDFKNIFGSLLVGNENSQQEPLKTNEQTTTENQEPLESNEVPAEKPELPRINVDNDVNVMLNSGKKPSVYNYDYTANNVQDRSYEDKIVHSNKASTSVKQYIDNVHKQTLISRATTVTEEVNLEGINIREYSKMNNKLIKNSNYIYSNKLSLALALLFAGLIIIESVVSFVVLNIFNSLQPFEIVYFSSCFAIALSICCVFVNKYIKEKFKVELKNYNFKTNLFYFALIFVVCLVLVVCINIFAGMNINNSGEFYIKIIFEILLLTNLILYPITKLLFFKMRCFSN